MPKPSLSLNLIEQFASSRFSEATPEELETQIGIQRFVGDPVSLSDPQQVCSDKSQILNHSELMSSINVTFRQAIQSDDAEVEDASSVGCSFAADTGHLVSSVVSDEGRVQVYAIAVSVIESHQSSPEQHRLNASDIVRAATFHHAARGALGQPVMADPIIALVLMPLFDDENEKKKNMVPIIYRFEMDQVKDLMVDSVGDVIKTLKSIQNTFAKPDAKIISGTGKWTLSDGVNFK
eukprot:gb/GECH01013072.1/.p1 GENE.gb/GECH01013072.1/~~gb/GECH01013072.1/.p1  ORF type:complete len:236 (+),score=69.41 gb/GECH01013072.1/:1-708(+)